MRNPAAEFLIADLPPQDGRDWDGQCARCGSSVAMFAPPRECLSSAAWCEANPIEGREHVHRGEIEWFTFDPRGPGLPVPVELEKSVLEFLGVPVVEH